MISSSTETFHRLTPYNPPEWCKHLKNIPKFRIPLAMKPTPILPWKIEEIPQGFELFVKRDDMTGSDLTGNKVRKLEFLMADAVAKGCASVITTGRPTSNHCRATVIAARQLGLDCYIIYRNLDDVKDKSTENIPNGNKLLCKIGNASSFLYSWDGSQTSLERDLKKGADYIKTTTGKPAYPISTGGTGEIGLYGYLYAWEEMIQQNILENFDDVVVTAGSTGTVTSLCIANYLTGSKLRVHAISINRSSETIHFGNNKMLRKIGIDDVNSEDILKTHDQYTRGGYSHYTDEDVAFCANIASSTGIYCDPIYSGKGLRGMINEMKANPSSFKGKRILFIHTGGIFGIMDSAMAKKFNKQNNGNSKHWNEIFPEDC